MMFLWLPIVIVVPLALIWMATPNAGVDWATRGARAHAQSASGPDATDTARQCLARGQITSAEFEEIRRVLA
jgi:uncharacterized membrane protein